MPLVIMTGIPSSGKTRTAHQLKGFLEENRGCSVIVVSENDIVKDQGDKNDILSDSRKEKSIRDIVKSETIRHISKDSVVICDGLNYVKGYRYELYCASKSYKTTHCVIHCDVSPEEAWAWNESRPDEKYTKDVFDGLVARYETPNGTNRWDSPLFLSLSSRPLDCMSLSASLFDRAPPPPNQSTQCQPLSSTSFLHELDKATSQIVATIVAAQKDDFVEGDEISIAGTEEKVVLPRRVTLAELSRTKRQFINYGAKTRAIDDVDKLTTMFIKYINTSLQ